MVSTGYSPVTYSVDDFIEVEEESDVSLSTSDESKSISQSCYHSLQRAQAGERWVLHT